MKINIKHIENTFNYGSCMMAINLINSINTQIENVEFYVDCSTDEDLERLKLETGVENIRRYNIESSRNIIIRIINKIKRIYLNYFVSKIKNVIIIGGDDISEYYTIERLIKELNILERESSSKNIILLGQTMGPFTGERIEMARRCLAKTIIFTRDHYNYKYLKSLNFKNVTEGKDLAFLDLPKQENSNGIIKRYKLEVQSYVTIVLSGLVDSYTKDRKCYINNQVDIVRSIINNPRLSNRKIVLLAHVLRPEHADDRVVINNVLEELNNEERGKIVVITDELLPSEARAILGNGLFTITGRMHAAVSTFFMRKPAISLSYSVKYLGVIGNGLDVNNLIIEAADENLWKNNKISTLVDKKVNFILDNYDYLIKKINENVSRTSTELKNELDKVIRKLNLR